MKRGAAFLLLALSLGIASTMQAQTAIAPAPREIRSDGSREPVPHPEIANKENPLEVVARIIKNSKDVGDKLAMTDTGAETRGTQDKILKDIQSLIEQEENPPPKPDQNMNNKSDDMNKDKPPPDMTKKDDAMPMDGMKDMPPMKNDGMPMGGMGDEPRPRRPRQDHAGEPKENKGQPKDPMNKEQGQPMAGKQPKDPKNTGGNIPDPKNNGKTTSQPTLPFEVELVKDVWGHLPDKLRQQATQYYQQDFMPRYSELLKLYYSSLSEKEMKK